ncbi:Fe(3+)-hydroxamate ABC transporter permease FhuB [Xanthobacteraceae bacterium A53D]
MAEAALAPRSHFAIRPWMLAAALLVPAAILAVLGFTGALPAALWRAGLLAPDMTDTKQILAHYSLLPRSAVAVLAGAALGLSGAIFQQVLRNPLASDTTLGIAAGAKLALAAAMLWAPGLLVFGPEGVALAGGAGALAIVFALAWRTGLSPLTVVLAGMVLALYCGALAAMLVLINHQYLEGLFIWGSGSLVQQSWDTSIRLGVQLAIAGVLLALMIRPLTLLSLEEAGAQSLGVSLHGTRLAALSLAIVLAACVVAGVGVIGFVGLIAPSLARLSGARRLRDQLVWAPVLGAGLLWLTDQLVLRSGSLNGGILPTGAVTALFGSPLLLWLLPRLRAASLPTRTGPGLTSGVRRRAPLMLGGLALVVALAFALSLTFARTPDGGWAFTPLADLPELMQWRLPRTVAALSAGAMLALAGGILQRLTRNPMASPEVLGVGAGAAFGLLLALHSYAAADREILLAASCAGAFAVLLVIVLLSRKSGFTADRVLLAGIALGALCDALVGALTASGDPHAMRLLNWMMGSTYGVDDQQALWAVGCAVVLIGLTALCLRWLDLMPLGDAPGQAVGLNLNRSRLILLALAAMLTAAGTLVVGPLTFVGLMAPHLAARLGLRRAFPQLAGAVLMGGLIMLLADWLGRMVAYPWQMPAGLLATLIGGPVLMWLLARR